MGWQLHKGRIIGYAGREIVRIETKEESNPRSGCGSEHVSIFVDILVQKVGEGS